MKKSLPIGVSDFKELIEDDYYYVDKTLLIKEILSSRPKVLLLPRPRRFGKTLNLSMLHYFFEQSTENTRALFDDTNIAQYPTCMKEQGQHPVIFISLKGVNKDTWRSSFAILKDIISLEFQRHNYLLEDDLFPEDKELFQKIRTQTATPDALSNSLFFLSKLLHNHYKKRVIILIDEYDAPITAGYNKGYYKQVVDFMRSLLTNACKDNKYLRFSVLTGILRVAKESIFSGLNNLAVHTVLSERYQDAFGFTEQEVQNFLENQDLPCSFDAIKEWYNGYLFGNVTIYNPWSIITCADNQGRLAPYWINTSDNELIEKLLIRSGQKVKKDFEQLLANQTLETYVDEATVYPRIERDSQAVWSLLLFAGYASVASVRFVDEIPLYTLRAPNKEIKFLYTVMIKRLFSHAASESADDLLLALTTGDSETFAYLLQEFIASSISMFDFAKDPENSYHLFILGLLVYLNDRYEIKSNRESGYGRYDIMVIPRDSHQLGIIIEFKKILGKETLEEAAQRAIEQIQQKNYAREMHDRGITNILLLGISLRGKEIFVLSVHA